MTHSLRALVSCMLLVAALLVCQTVAATAAAPSAGRALQPQRPASTPIVQAKSAARPAQSKVAAAPAPLYVTQYSLPQCQSTLVSSVTQLPDSCITLNGGTYYIKLGSCGSSGSLWFDYYRDRECTVTLGGSPGYPNDGTYHTEKVTAQAPCITLANNVQTAFALSCTSPVPVSTQAISGTWTINQFTDAQCSSALAGSRTTGTTGDCVVINDRWLGPTARQVNCFKGTPNTFTVLDYVGQTDCLNRTTLATGAGTVGDHGEASACSQVEPEVYVTVSCPSSAFRSLPALFTAATAMLFGAAVTVY